MKIFCRGLILCLSVSVLFLLLPQFVQANGGQADCIPPPEIKANLANGAGLIQQVTVSVEAVDRDRFRAEYIIKYEDGKSDVFIRILKREEISDQMVSDFLIDYFDTAPLVNLKH